MEAQKVRIRELWRLNCEQLADMDSSLAEKDEKISCLRDEVTHLCASSPGACSGISEVSKHGVEENVTLRAGCSHARRRKAPPVDTFTGEDPECHLNDWLPTLKRAVDWND